MMNLPQADMDNLTKKESPSAEVEEEVEQSWEKIEKQDDEPKITEPAIDNGTMPSLGCLSLKELCGIAERGDFLKKLVGNYVRQTYPKLQFECTTKPHRLFNDTSKALLVLKDYAQHVTLVDSDSSDFQLLADTFPKELKSIRFRSVAYLKASNVELIKEQLKTVEEIIIDYDEAEGGLYYCLLTHCPNLKRLSINNLHGKRARSDFQYDGELPHLEHFYWNGMKSNYITSLQDFLSKHEHIKSIGLHQNNFEGSSNSLTYASARYTYIESAFNLMQLLNGNDGGNVMENIHVKVKGDFLISNQGYFIGLKGLTSIDVENLNPANGDVQIILDRLKNLKKLKILNLRSLSYAYYFDNLENKLEVLDIVAEWDRNIILKVIRSFKQLKELYLRQQKDISLFEEYDIEKLTDERSCLPDASKLTIYVDENTFLKQKHRWEVIDTALIQLKPFYREYDDAIMHI